MCCTTSCYICVVWRYACVVKSIHQILQIVVWKYAFVVNFFQVYVSSADVFFYMQIEMTNDVQFLLPIMASIMVAKWVGDFFTHPYYLSLMELKCIPYLDAEPIVKCNGHTLVIYFTVYILTSTLGFIDCFFFLLTIILFEAIYYRCCFFQTIVISSLTILLCVELGYFKVGAELKCCFWCWSSVTFRNHVF